MSGERPAGRATKSFGWLLRRLVPALAAAVIAATALPYQSRAQTVDPEALAAATELAQILSEDTQRQLVQQVGDVVWPPTEGQLRSLHIDDATISDIRLEVERILFDSLNSTMQAVPALYAKHFTASELREMTAFYRTPVGAKALAQMPVIMRDSMMLVVAQLPAMQTELKFAVAGVLSRHGYK